MKKRSLEDSVVIFEPRVSLVEGGLPCQGVLKTDREFVIVETLTACAEDVVKKIGDGQSVLLYRDGRKLVGMVKALGDVHTSQGHLGVALSSGPLAGSENPLESVLDGTVAHYICNHDEDEHLVSMSVMIGTKSEVNDKVSYQLDDSGLPPGASVSRNGELLCLATGSGRCMDVSQTGGRLKRSLSKRQLADCMLTKIDCTGFMLDGTCDNGNGAGTCRHDDTDCTVGFVSVTSPVVSQSESVRCGSCVTSYGMGSGMTGTLYSYANGTFAGDQNNPPECFPRVTSSALGSAAGVGTLALLLALSAFMY